MKSLFYPQRLPSLFCGLFLTFSFTVFGQVGIGNTNPNGDALLELGDATTTTKGLLLPRVNLVATNSATPLSAHELGMVVYNKNTAGDVTPGYYYNDGTQWVRLAADAPSDDWSRVGNAGTNAGTNFLGTTDNVALRFRTSNTNAFEISGGDATNRGKLRAITNGTAALPVYSFSNSIASGMYSSGSNILAFSTNGNERMRLLANGQVVVNNTDAPFIGDRLTVQGGNNEYAINGYATGASGVGVNGTSTGSGNGVRGTNNNSGIGVIGFSSLTGTGMQGQNSGTGYGMAAFNSGTGGALYLQSNLVNIYSNLTGAGGVGEYIDFDNRNGLGVDVVGVIDPSNPSVGTAGDVWAFSGTIKTQTPTTTTVSGGVVLGNQYGVGHNMLLRHSGSAGRNAEINSLNPTNTDPNIVAIGLNSGSTMLVQNQNDNLPVAVSPLVVGDFGYLGSDLDDHIGISGYSNPSLNSRPFGIGVDGYGAWYGVVGTAGHPLGYGVYSNGDTGASGTKFFAIDDPRDPANKILRHASIESNEILNLYRGTETFDAHGKVIVTLPEYYEVINKNPSYQLTPIGAAMPNIYIEKELKGGTFVIAGGLPGKKVSWMVTSERNDPYLQKYPEKREMVVDKGEKRGKYFMPELYGQPKEKGYGYHKPTPREVTQANTNSGAVVREMAKPNLAETVKKDKVKNTTQRQTGMELDVNHDSKIQAVPDSSQFNTENGY